jgi:hypothetical protein
VGQPISGSFLFEDATPPSPIVPNPGILYPNSVISMSFGSVQPVASQIAYTNIGITPDSATQYGNIQAYLNAISPVGVSDVYTFLVSSPPGSGLIQTYNLTDLIAVNATGLITSSSEKRFEFMHSVPQPNPVPGQFGYQVLSVRADISQLNISVAFPESPTLDHFNYPHGKLGPNWSGNNDARSYKVVDNEVHVGNGGAIYWSPSSFGPDQEAFVTLTTVDPTAREQDLLLKVQGDPAKYTRGEIEVLYDARAHAVRVETLLPRHSSWTQYSKIPVTFQDGDQMGGRVYSTGKIHIYRNHHLIGEVTLNADDQKFFNHNGGSIGLWFDAAPNAVFDDFGGGSITP